MAGNRSGGKDQKTQALPAPDAGKAGGNMGSSLPPPPAPPGPSGAPTGPQSGAKTQMLDRGAPSPVVQAPQRQQVVPTMMKSRPEELPPMRGPQRAWGRWVMGPLLSVIVAAGSFYAARAVLPKPQKGPPPKPQGRLRLSSDPTGATVTLDGKLHPHFTPTTVEGDVGASVHVSFALDGYKPKDADLVFGESERAFTAHLEKAEASPVPVPVPVPVPAKSSHKSAAVKEPKLTGTAKISVHVHPWAIVYVDGSKVHQTPVVDLELSAGKHVIELVNEGKNRREKVPIVVKPDEPQDIKRDWDQ